VKVVIVGSKSECHNCRSGEDVYALAMTVYKGGRWLLIGTLTSYSEKARAIFQLQGSALPGAAFQTQPQRMIHRVEPLRARSTAPILFPHVSCASHSYSQILVLLPVDTYTGSHCYSSTRVTLRSAKACPSRSLVVAYAGTAILRLFGRRQAIPFRA
jgi:hypothetical protein